jgi:hypothetical protein
MGRSLGFARVAALAVPLLSCGWFGGKANSASWPLQSADKVPAASGQVTVSQENDANHVVNVTVEHLAHPGDAFPGASTYVVWLVPNAEGGHPENVGVLQLDTDLKGHLQARTPYRSFQVVITAEEQPNVTAPSNDRVLTTSVALPG